MPRLPVPSSVRQDSIPATVRSTQISPEIAATAHTQMLQDAVVQISMAEVGAAWQKGCDERLMRTMKEEEVDLPDYEDYDDAARQLGRFLDEVYVHKRIHSSLGYLTPTEFEEQWRREQLQVALATKNRSKCVQS